MTIDFEHPVKLTRRQLIKASLAALGTLGLSAVLKGSSRGPDSPSQPVVVPPKIEPPKVPLASPTPSPLPASTVIPTETKSAQPLPTATDKPNPTEAPATKAPIPKLSDEMLNSAPNSTKRAAIHRDGSYEINEIFGKGAPVYDETLMTFVVKDKEGDIIATHLRTPLSGKGSDSTGWVHNVDGGGGYLFPINLMAQPGIESRVRNVTDLKTHVTRKVDFGLNTLAFNNFSEKTYWYKPVDMSDPKIIAWWKDVYGIEPGQVRTELNTKYPPKNGYQALSNAILEVAALLESNRTGKTVSSVSLLEKMTKGEKVIMKFNSDGKSYEADLRKGVSIVYAADKPYQEGYIRNGFWGRIAVDEGGRLFIPVSILSTDSGGNTNALHILFKDFLEKNGIFPSHREVDGTAVYPQMSLGLKPLLPTPEENILLQFNPITSFPSSSSEVFSY